MLTVKCVLFYNDKTSNIDSLDSSISFVIRRLQGLLTNENILLVLGLFGGLY